MARKKIEAAPPLVSVAVLQAADAANDGTGAPKQSSYDFTIHLRVDGRDHPACETGPEGKNDWRNDSFQPKAERYIDCIAALDHPAFCQACAAVRNESRAKGASVRFFGMLVRR